MRPKVGPGCDHCYAERFAERWRGTPGHPYEQGFDLRLWPTRLNQPARWRKPRTIFVNSMSDLFHKDIPRAFIDRVFDAMEATDRHIYQVLTKRSPLMARLMSDRGTRMGRCQGISGWASRSRTRPTPVVCRTCGRSLPRSGSSRSHLCWRRWGMWTWPTSPGPSSAARAALAPGPCAANGSPRYATSASATVSRGGARPKSGGRMLDGVTWNGFPRHSAPGNAEDPERKQYG